MPVVINHESDLGKELLKWEQHRTKYVGDDQTPGNPYAYRPFPKMLYKAAAWIREQGKVRCQAPLPTPYGWKTPDEYHQAELETERFNRDNLITVRTVEEWQLALRDGWRGSPLEAEQYYEALQQDIAQAAAEVNFGVRRMSDKAQAEHAAAGESTHEHVVDVVGVPKSARPWSAERRAKQEAAIRRRKARVVTGSGEQE